MNTSNEGNTLQLEIVSKERNMTPDINHRPSVTITPPIAAKIKRLSKGGLYQHEIAAMISCNQGRVSEVLSGKRFPEVQPEASA